MIRRSPWRKRKNEENDQNRYTDTHIGIIEVNQGVEVTTTEKITKKDNNRSYI